MRNVIALLIAGLSPVLVAAAENKTVTLSRSGYSIDVLDPGLAEAGVFESFKMLLPPKEGFASNVNVQHQKFAGTLSDYKMTSEANLKEIKLTVSNARLENGAYTAEAVGKVRGLEFELHFYFKAIKSGDNVILATAAIPSSRWDTEKELLLPIINSLVPTKK